MVARRPLVTIAGVLQEIPTGDILTSSTTFNEVTRGIAVLDFGSGNSTALITIVGQTTIVANSFVSASLLPTVTTDHNVDEHTVEEITVMAGNIIVGTGFTIYGKTNNVALYGKYNVGWSWT